MKNATRAAFISLLGGLLFYGLTAFTVPTQPARHVTYGGAFDIGATTSGLLIMTPVSGGTGRVLTSILQVPFMEVSTGLGAGTLLATGTTYAGTTMTAGGKLTNLTMFVSVASSNTASNEIFTATDGTNTCTFTFACDATTGQKSVIGVDAAGTGCTYATNANVNFSLTAQGCGTAMTVKNIRVLGLPSI